MGLSGFCVWRIMSGDGGLLMCGEGSCGMCAMNGVVCGEGGVFWDGVCWLSDSAGVGSRVMGDGEGCCGCDG